MVRVLAVKQPERNHETGRLSGLLRDRTGPVSVNDQYSLLRAGGFCFSVARDTGPALKHCATDDLVGTDPAALAERLHTHGGFSTPLHDGRSRHSGAGRRRALVPRHATMRGLPEQCRRRDRAARAGRRPVQPRFGGGEQVHDDANRVGSRIVEPVEPVAAHWCTLVVSVVIRPLMHLRCRRVIALLA
jgi:hypothetical protein